MKRTTSMLTAWLLALALAGAAGQASAQALWNNGETFEHKPKMNYIPNTDVYYERKASGFDRYRYANTWYIVENGDWYRSYSWQGPYVMIDPSDVPEEIMVVPASYRRFWRAAAPIETDRDLPEGAYAWPGSFSRKPSMHNISASGVSYSHRARDYDLYRFRSTWYVVDDGAWYRADSWRGPFLSIPAAAVPREVLRVPSRYRRHWITPAGF